MALNLIPGVCLFCSNESKLLVASSKDKEMLRDILLDFLNISKFSTTVRLLKVCPLCLWELHRIAEHNNKIHGFVETHENCSLCKCTNNLVTIRDWSYFDKMLLNLNMQRRRGCSVCLECISHINSITKIKSAVFRKFPQLAETTNKSQARIFSNLNQLCKVLRPSKQYNLKQYKDKKLSKQILFVSLKQSDKIRKVLKPQPPFIMRMKIKRKNASKKGENKVITGRIEKRKKRTPKSQTKFIDKQLIINLININSEELKKSNNILLTPTRERNISEDPQSSTKKSVTFSNNVTTDRGSPNILLNGTPMKSSLKKTRLSIEEDVSNESEIKDEAFNSNITALLKSMQEDNSNIEIVVESDKMDYTDIADKSNETVEKSNGIDDKSVDQNETGNQIIDVSTTTNEDPNLDLSRLIDGSLPLHSVSDEDVVSFQEYKKLNATVSTADVNLKDQPTNDTDVAG